jgi:hypothetical protein
MAKRLWCLVVLRLENRICQKHVGAVEVVSFTVLQWILHAIISALCQNG